MAEEKYHWDTVYEYTYNKYCINLYASNYETHFFSPKGRRSTAHGAWERYSIMSSSAPYPSLWVWDGVNSSVDSVVLRWTCGACLP